MCETWHFKACVYILDEVMKLKSFTLQVWIFVGDFYKLSKFCDSSIQTEKIKRTEWVAEPLPKFATCWNHYLGEKKYSATLHFQAAQQGSFPLKQLVFGRKESGKNSLLIQTKMTWLWLVVQEWGIAQNGSFSLLSWTKLSVLSDKYTVYSSVT